MKLFYIAFKSGHSDLILGPGFKTRRKAERWVKDCGHQFSWILLKVKAYASHPISERRDKRNSKKLRKLFGIRGDEPDPKCLPRLGGYEFVDSPGHIFD